MKYIKTHEGLFDFFKKKETDPKKIEIIKLCKQYNITKYTINDDYSIDVDDHVDLSSKKLTKIPIKFNRVNGYFSCVGNMLVNLENAPRWVERNFMCQNQYYGTFISLKGAPEYVGFRFDFNENENLKDFSDFPSYVGATIDARSTGLYSFDCIPESTTRLFIDEYTPLYTVLRCVSSATFPILVRSGGAGHVEQIFIDVNGRASEAIETFKAYDPIHPPKNEGDKPILYMDRFRMLLEEIGKKTLSNLLYSKDSDTYRKIETYYDIRNNEYKIDEGLFDYFKKENKDKRNQIKAIKAGIIKLVNGYKLRIDNSWGNEFKGNTRLSTDHGTVWININDDLTVDVIGKVGIRFGYDIKDLPCKFNIVTENFFVELSYAIESFIHKFPEKVGNNLSIKDCGLDSLKNLPTKHVGGKFDCQGNNLKTLEGIPECDEIKADSNDIYTFEGLENFRGDVSLYLNPINNISFNDDKETISLEQLIIRTSVHNRQDLQDVDSNLDIFKSCDPIHPPLTKGGKPIIYLNRMNAFADQLDLVFRVQANALERVYDIR